MKQLLLCLLFVVPVLADEPLKQPTPERVKVSLTAEQLAKMPRWGKISASNPQSIKVDIGWRYMGDRFVAAVDFVNDTKSPIELGEVTSGCGCTAAGPINNMVDPGTTVPIIFKIKRERLARFEVKSQIHWGSHAISITKSGVVRPQVVFEPLDIGRDGVGTLSYKIKDKRLSGKEFSFAMLNTSFEITNVTPTYLEVKKTNRNAFPNSLTVITRAGKEELPPQTVPTRHLGAFKVIPPLLTAAQDENIRLFLIGGVGDSNDVKTATITVGSVKKKVGVVIKESSSRKEVNLEPLGLSPGSHRVSVTIGEIEFSFHLRQVDKR